MEPAGDDEAPVNEVAIRSRPHRSVWLDLTLPVLGIGGVIAAIFGVQRLMASGDGSKPPDGSGGPEFGITGEGSPDIGETAPDFLLVSPNGAQVRLSDLRGKPVVVNFWATWCPPCVREIPDFVALQTEWGDRIQIVGVDLQEPPENASLFVEQFGINYLIGLDRDGEVTQAYKLTGLPETFFLDRDGTIRDHRIGQVSQEVARCIGESIAAGSHEPEDCR